MTADQARHLRRGDTVVFVPRNPWAVPIKGIVRDCYQHVVRIEWDDEWTGTYDYNGLGQMDAEDQSCL